MEENAEKLAARIAQLAADKKAEGILLLDLKGLAAFTDFFVICGGAVDIQVKAIVDHIVEGMEGAGHHPHHIEGYSHLKWVLIDFGEVVVHVFQRQIREFYRLESLWGDAQITEVGD